MLGNDHWTIDLEQLGMHRAGDQLAKLTLTCRPPYAVCVQGKWGSGKTSLMRYAMARLGGQPLAATLATDAEPLEEISEDLRGIWRKQNGDSVPLIRETFEAQLPTDFNQKKFFEPLIVPIWFNAWQHQRAELPVVGLLRELKSQFTTLVKLGGQVKSLTKDAVEAALPLLDELADILANLQFPGAPGTGGTFGRLPEFFRAGSKARFETLHDTQRLNLLFEAAVKRLLKGKKDSFLEFKPEGKGGDLAGEKQIVVQKRLVIFIDDLDRCAEEQTVHLLEAIKLYLQTPYCVFVLGMDGAAARRALNKELGQGEEVAREYLEKLFQSVVYVPLPKGSPAFVEKLLRHVGLEEEQTGMKAAEMAPLILELIEPNPRKLKIFIGSLASGWCLDGDAKEDFALYLLLNYLRSLHPEIYRLISYDPQQAENLHHAATERSLPNNPTPVDLFLHRALRHAYDRVPSPEEHQAASRAELALELIERLDHVKGDRAFCKQWRLWSENLHSEERMMRIGRFLARDEVQL